MPNYPDPAEALTTWLADIFDAGPHSEYFRRIVPELPADLFTDTGLPCVVVNRYGGHDPIPGIDDCAVDLDVYCTGPDPYAARVAALARSEDLRRAIRVRLPGVQLGIGGPVVSRIRTISAPTIRPYDSRHQIRKAQASYSIRLHSRL